MRCTKMIDWRRQCQRQAKEGEELCSTHLGAKKAAETKRRNQREQYERRQMSQQSIKGRVDERVETLRMLLDVGDYDIQAEYRLPRSGMGGFTGNVTLNPKAVEALIDLLHQVPEDGEGE